MEAKKETAKQKLFQKEECAKLPAYSPLEKNILKYSTHYLFDEDLLWLGNY